MRQFFNAGQSLILQSLGNELNLRPCRFRPKRNPKPWSLHGELCLFYGFSSRFVSQLAFKRLKLFLNESRTISGVSISNSGTSAANRTGYWSASNRWMGPTPERPASNAFQVEGTSRRCHTAHSRDDDGFNAHRDTPGRPAQSRASSRDSRLFDPFPLHIIV